MLDHKFNKVYSDTASITFTNEEEVFSPLRLTKKISISEIRSGEYTLELSVLGRRDRVVNKKTSSFLLFWSPEAMVLYDYETAVQQLKYIADPKDIKKIKEIN